MPEAVNDPIVVMLWGITPQRLQEWAAPQERQRAERRGRLAGRGRGPARVVRGLGDLDTVRQGEILVCTITSPAWAPIFSKIVATVTDIGGIMSHAAIVVARVRAAGGGRHRHRDVAHPHRSAAAGQRHRRAA